MIDLSKIYLLAYKIYWDNAKKGKGVCNKGKKPRGTLTRKLVDGELTLSWVRLGQVVKLPGSKTT